MQQGILESSKASSRMPKEVGYGAMGSKIKPLGLLELIDKGGGEIVGGPTHCQCAWRCAIASKVYDLRDWQESIHMQSGCSKVRHNPYEEYDRK